MFSVMSFRLAELYLTAKQAVIEAGFEEEIDWQFMVDFESVDESDFLREASWVILSSGFRESVVRHKFPKISESFLYWKSAAAIVERQVFCRQKSLSIFANHQKIDAIIRLSKTVSATGFASVKSNIQSFGTTFLQTFPYVGPITSYHLAKNLGLNVVKPDRHLARAASCAGIRSPHIMCEMIQAVVGDPISVVDIVIWRYAVINPQYWMEFQRITQKS